MNEYFVPIRPGIAAAQRKRHAEDIIASQERNIERERETWGEGAMLRYTLERANDTITQARATIAECDAILATADPDEPILQEIDYLEGAMREMANSRKRFVGHMAARIEALRESNPAEALRIAKLVPGDPDGLRDLFVNRVLNGFANTEYMNALENHRKMWE